MHKSPHKINSDCFDKWTLGFGTYNRKAGFFIYCELENLLSISQPSDRLSTEMDADLTFYIYKYMLDTLPISPSSFQLSINILYHYINRTA